MDRQLFFQSLGRMLALSNEPLLVDRLPINDINNVSARILRLGLSVTAFASLERYVEDCFGLAVQSLAGARIGYSNFPEDLRSFLTVKAVEGLATKGGFVPAPDRLAYFESHIPKVAKYAETPPIFTSLGFSPRGSNVAASDIAAAFNVLKVKKPWTVLSSIAASMGGASLDLENDFTNLSKTRHRAAHNPQFNIPTSDLQNNLRAAIAIGISVDILAKLVSDRWAAAGRISEVSAQVAALIYPMRFIDDGVGSIFIERAASTGRAVKHYVSESLAVTGAAGRSTSSFVIRRDASGRPLALADATTGPFSL